MQNSMNRRGLIKATSWSVPSVAFAVAVPSSSASVIPGYTLTPNPNGQYVGDDSGNQCFDVAVIGTPADSVVTFSTSYANSGAPLSDLTLDSSNTTQTLTASTTQVCISFSCYRITGGEKWNVTATYSGTQTANSVISLS